ncbi:hypothetical protein RHMOL_Rhmol04G0029200 [Rhododendron molle]|uniref:Uncharacterized protein n=1 Tax=Rhododendron molle TaxID=49168 RepID=A0ACC0NXJ9_RHOML|nr:hypothetical protein RHMOL_Rhmol04G0029200 [Rhododendron molle]
MSSVPFTRTRIPELVSFNTPALSKSGVSLLATHTTVIIGSIFLYHIPTYRFVEFPGLKKPSSKIPPDETMVSPSASDFVVAMVSTPLEVIKMENIDRDNMQRGTPTPLSHRNSPPQTHTVRPRQSSPSPHYNSSAPPWSGPDAHRIGAVALLAKAWAKGNPKDKTIAACRDLAKAGIEEDLVAWWLRKEISSSGYLPAGDTHPRVRPVEGGVTLTTWRYGRDTC